MSTYVALARPTAPRGARVVRMSTCTATQRAVVTATMATMATMVVMIARAVVTATAAAPVTATMATARATVHPEEPVS